MPEPSAILQQLQAQRRLLLARDERAIRELTRRWLQVERAIDVQLEALSREVIAAHRAGQIVDPALVRRLARYETLQRQLYSEIDKYAADAGDMITGNQRQVADLAAKHMQDIIMRSGAVTGTFDRLPVAAFEHMVGHVAGGSPLYDYFLATMHREALDGMMLKLLEGVALGYNPKKTARLMRDGLGIAHNRAIMTARTETLRVYRYASLESYQASSVVVGWTWLASKDTRTCIACLVMDGSEHDLHESFDSHVQCRCTPVPIISGRPYDWQHGADWFKEQDADTQRAMLGASKFDAWQGKRISLDDLANHTHSPTFGGSWQTGSLSQALDNAARRRGQPLPTR